MRKGVAVFVGIFVSLTLVALIEGISSTVYPVPVDVVMSDRAVLTALIVHIPPLAKTIIVSSWLLAPFAGAWLCLRIADWPTGGWMVTVIVLIAGLVGHSGVPYPLWMQVCALVLPVLGGRLAQRLHRKPYPGEPLLG